MGDSTRIFCALGLSVFLGTISIEAFAKSDIDEKFLAKIRERVCEGLLTQEQRDIIGSQWAGKTVFFTPDVIFNDPLAIHKYPGAKIVISQAVIRVATDKQDDPALGVSATKFMRNLLKVTSSQRASKNQFVLDDQGTTLVIDSRDYTRDFSEDLTDPGRAASRVLALAKQYANSGETVMVISDDASAQLNAMTMGVESSGYHVAGVKPVAELAKPLVRLTVTDAQYEEFMAGGHLPSDLDSSFRANDFFALVSPSHPPSEDAVGRTVYDREKKIKYFRKLIDFQKVDKLYGKPRNLEQKLALETMLDPNVSLVILAAGAGSGKTFLLMDLLMKFHDDRSKLYDRLLLSRPTTHFGNRKVGALPGDQDAKDHGFMLPFIDNYNALRDLQHKDGRANDRLKELPKYVEWMPYEYFRGISLIRTVAGTDETQNTTVSEMWDILSRMGEKSKLIFMGDPSSQIDDQQRFLNATNNGLAVAISAFSHPDLTDEERSHFAIVNLVVGERGEFNRLVGKVRGLHSDQ